jgi:hypothetical protein
MTRAPSDANLLPAAWPKRPPYASADPESDVRFRLAGTQWSEPGRCAFPTRTTTGEWMIRTMLDLPYTMLASLEVKAGSEAVGELIRAALVDAGYGCESDIVGVPADRHATDQELLARLGVLAELGRVRQVP